MIDTGPDSTIRAAEDADVALHSVEELAERLAEEHRVTRHPPSVPSPLGRLPRIDSILREAYEHFAQESEAEGEVSHAAEWILDNYYLVRQAIHLVREDMPSGYYRQLPKLEGGDLAGYPRIYAVARELVIFSEARLDQHVLVEFTQAYQPRPSLTTGELWALPIMLRLALVELLAETLSRLVAEQTEGQGRDVGAVDLTGSVSDDAIVASAVSSIRVLSTLDWKEFFEGVSRVEKVLRSDPSGVYPRMDYETRVRYREVIEEIALRIDQDEEQIAREAVALAESARRSHSQDVRSLHVGHYLIGEERARLEERVGYTPPWYRRLGRWIVRHAIVVYLSGIVLLTLAVVVGLALYAGDAGGSAWQVVAVGLLALLPASTVAVNVVNTAITKSVPPRVLPKMDYSEGIPDHIKGMVVIPTLLTSSAEVDALLHQIELHYLSNDDRQLRFALLTDWIDAPKQHMPGDDDLLEQVKGGIDALNERYASDGYQPFYLFHRRRLWNENEGCWMGWERKRGKLAEFNRYLLGDMETSFSVILGDVSALTDIRYVITLDADTVLPRDEGRRLIATMSHPLNRPIFSDGRVVSGYTVLQPRVELKPSSANRSLFTRVFAGDVGVDLYTRAVSDVYHDFFGEGIFVGKGIYDLEAFERSLHERVPENALLSHDLFEGIHGRAGLVTDVVLYEDYPPSYLAYALRLHRWVRGDWQLLPWLRRRVPNQHGEKIPNTLSVLDRWKLFDNIRRSLQPIALLALFVGGWVILPGTWLVWTTVALISSAMPFLAGALNAVLAAVNGRSLSAAVGPLRYQAARWLLGLALLPYEAGLTVDAIVRTLYRLLVSKRHLLEWTTASAVARLYGRQRSVGDVWERMWVAPTFALLSALVVAAVRLPALATATPLLLGWLCSPLLVYLISRPLQRKDPTISEEDRELLRRVARRTWLYFERLMGPDDHWLPPDHYQEEPRGLVAHRTSPTNIGLALLSTLASHDLGYSGLYDLTLRLRETFNGMAQLERYRGHFFNWYDTRSLDPLPPRYVSTVDSGNLAASLLVLRQGLLALLDEPPFRWQRVEGLLDTLSVLGELVYELRESNVAATVRPLLDHLEHIREHVRTVRDAPRRWSSMLSEIGDEDWPELERLLIELAEAGSGTLKSSTLRGLRVWTERARYQFVTMTDELDRFIPWLLRLDQLPELFLRDDLPPDVTAAWQALGDELPVLPTLRELPEVASRGMELVARLRALVDGLGADEEEFESARIWCAQLAAGLEQARSSATEVIEDFEGLAQEAAAYMDAMHFDFLFDESRQVFYLGYNVSDERLDTSHYDLLACEARTASLIAIANGDVPQSHWLHMDRPVARVDGRRVLLSWNGSMFEYLMPELLARSYDDMLLGQACRAALDVQMRYGQRRGVPWGISESGYYLFDANMNYQYRGFGVPGLGRKRGLNEDLVVAPYASILGVRYRPDAVVRNLRELIGRGMLGLYGFYESIDFTRSRLPLGRREAIVQSFMVHHAGMSLLALCNYLCDDVMVARFRADPRMESVDLLLQEQAPLDVPLEELPEHAVGAMPTDRGRADIGSWSVAADAPHPEAHLLSNGTYGLLITAAGGGYSQWEDLALTRWRADTTLDCWGTWVYVRDSESGALWSATRQPLGRSAEVEDVRFWSHRADFRRQVEGISFHTAVTVAPNDDVEIRLVTLTNSSGRTRHLFLSSYGEVTLAPQDVDRRHPAFTKLFIESEYLPELNALLFRRRPRASDEPPVYLLHMLVPGGDEEPTGAYETDRGRFLGRGRTVRNPLALSSQGDGLSNTAGATLDPILCIGQALDLPDAASTRVALVTLAAGSRQEALALARRYRSMAALDHAFGQAEFLSQREARDAGLDTDGLRRMQQLFSVLTFPYGALRADGEILAANPRGQSGLWPFAVSGDYPILLVRVNEPEEIPLVREALRAHAYWRHRGAMIDLVILNERDTGYAQELHDHLHRLVARMHGSAWLNRRGGIFMLRADQLSRADRLLLGAAARAVLRGDRGSLAEQLGALRERPTRAPQLVPTLTTVEERQTAPVQRPEDLLFDNGYGGFTQDGREYVIYLDQDRWTPSPWVNVVANEELGFLISEAGSGYSWAVNSGENRLTPWQNDPVSDLPGEALYLRDEETAQVWSPTPQPVREASPYVIRHGAGYSVFEHNSQGLAQRMRVFVAPDAPVKIVQLHLRNLWDRPRRITATYYAEWVLGITRDQSQQYIVPEYDTDTETLLAANTYNEEFGSRVAFLASDRDIHGLTADRTEFLGRLGDRSLPAALTRVGLSGRVVPGLDPCAALQVYLDLEPGGEETVCFLLGEGPDRHAALELVRRFRDREAVESAWRGVGERWDAILDAVQVETPDPGINVLLNRWYLYQALSCRIWARSGLYQSSGAYGFRDQLQDVTALVHAAPDLAREHILRAARHQFEEGDVLHWWHPPSGRGVRTRISDDLLWLPYVTAHYVETTGDQSLLDERTPFLTGDPLSADEEERYAHYEPSGEEATVYEHCLRALKRGATSGPHDLPLIGGGDWNDGMNRVGIRGRGESVWLAWFLYATLTRFAEIAERRGAEEDAEWLRQRAEGYRVAVGAEAWDGDWYLRGFYDDGTPLGSCQSQECQIDAISQSWSLLSGAVDPHADDRDASRSRRAMESVMERLVRSEDRLILLFTPPFDQTPQDPGYIKGYPPGIRENGGQYTHSAIWTVWAFVELGRGDTALDLYRLLCPVYHADTMDKAQRYRVEPYVVAADVYGVAPHTGRGGWTWYTGSAAWMYRLGLEGILGVRRRGDELVVRPTIPSGWSGFSLTYRYGRTTYHIRVDNPQGVQQGVQEVTLDGVSLPGEHIRLSPDGGEHAVHVRMG